MRSYQVQIIIVLLSFVLSLSLLVMGAKYAEWASPMVKGSQGNWLSLVFYLGTIPMISLLYTTLHLFALHFDLLPTVTHHQPAANESAFDFSDISWTATFIFVVSILQFWAWVGQAMLCTVCELGPIMSGNQGRVPAWCPQSRFRDQGIPGLADMLAMLATVKDVGAWVMVFVSAIGVECARRAWAGTRELNGNEYGYATGYGNRERSNWKNGGAADVAMEMKSTGKNYNLGQVQRSATMNYESRV